MSPRPPAAHPKKRVELYLLVASISWADEMVGKHEAASRSELVDAAIRYYKAKFDRRDSFERFLREQHPTVGRLTSTK